MVDFIKERKFFLIFLTIVLFFLLNNYFWLLESNNLHGVAVPNNLLFQLRFNRLWNGIISESGADLFNKMTQTIRLMSTSMFSKYCVYWPNFVYFSSSLFTNIVGNSLLKVKLTMSFYFFLLFFSTYAITAKIADKKTGLFAVALLGLYPLIFESSRQYGLDFPLTAIVALAIWLLLKTDRFTNTFFSVLCGLIAGIGMLIKGQFIIFFIVPLLLVFREAAVRNKILNEKPRVLLNIALMLFLFIIIAGIWWFGKIPLVLNGLFYDHIRSSKILEMLSFPKIYSLAFYLFYVKTLLFSSLGIAFTLLFLVSVGVIIKNKVEGKLILVSWFVVPFLLFSFYFVAKEDRFLMPVLPVFAIVSALGIQKIKKEKWNNCLVLIFMTLGLIQYYLVSYFGYHYCPEGMKRRFRFLGSSSYGGVYYYDREKEILIKNVAQGLLNDFGKDEICKVGTIVTAGDSGTFEVLYWLSYYNKNLELHDWLENYFTFYKELPQMQYVILISYGRDNLTWLNETSLDLVERYGVVNLKIWKACPDWDKNYNNLCNAKSEFYLQRRIVSSKGLSWYVYKRIFKKND